MVLPVDDSECQARNLPACNGDDADKVCTYYDPDADYNTFSALEFSTAPVSGDVVFSYIELQDWWDLDPVGLAHEMTITPIVINDDGSAVAEQPDFSEWYVSFVSMRVLYYDIETVIDYEMHLRYEFMMQLPSEWGREDYDGETMKFAFLI